MSCFLCELNQLIEIINGNKSPLHVYLAPESSEEVVCYRHLSSVARKRMLITI